ncbi:MAG: hypothetical protein ACOYL5_06500 [Phototrophicaceae bacterium]|jgi:hypothetical protein
MNPQQERQITGLAALALLVILGLGVGLVLDLIYHGAVWRALQALRASNTSTLPNETRTVGERHRADLTFLS